ncbi:MAG: hypothetical protein OXC47_02450 [Cyanobacteria bacterium MAG APA_bin_95]|uniref:Uncharacterized protein n=1 Tax=Candidatus Synechococcus spongiarum LMB bulk15M TaxID=1943582 RepID=A0A1T1CBS0_9SYNE|nr:hypothetical protein [Cyanobacteria bacterium MAG APA_bin_95]OOV26001.1 hypothetical protein BV61_06790 [Candidatus Synechococcus spongiarum LMB bulk15M]
MNSIPLWQRGLGLAMYLLPWSDAFVFSRPFFGLELVPLSVRTALILPALPLNWINSLVPFGLGPMLLLLALFFAVVRNPQAPYFLRFNALQAILVDIILLAAGYGLVVFGCRPGSVGGFTCDTFGNTLFLGSLLLVIFAFVECIRGREPELPSLSDAVRLQLF